MVIEAQINYIIEALDMMVAVQARAIEPTEAAYEEWNQRVGLIGCLTTHV